MSRACRVKKKKPVEKVESIASELTRKGQYRQYLKSPQWEGIRNSMREAYDNKCAVCGSEENLNIHHLTYERLYGEAPTDLICLCRTCHAEVHQKRLKIFLLSEEEQMHFEAVKNLICDPHVTYLVLRRKEDLHFTHVPEELILRKPTAHTTGGKKPYVKIMVQKLREIDIDTREAGVLTLLADNIEWGTGRVVRKRDKASLKAADMAEIVGLSKVTFSKTIRSLKAKGLVVINREGYFVSEEIFRKGR